MIASLRRTLPNSPFLPALLAFCLGSSLCFLYAWQNNFNFSIFVFAGVPTAHSQQLPIDFLVQDGQGHDGQFYYRLALDPFTSTRSAHGITLDNPAYRQQRVFYPLLVWILSLAQKSLVPFVMVAVNILSLSALGFLGGIWARKIGIHSLWGFLLALYPGFMFTLWLNLTEILQVTLLVSALLALHNCRQTLAAVLISLAVLTRETALFFALALFGSWVWQQFQNSRDTSRNRISDSSLISARVWILPITAYLIWQLVVWNWWDQLPATSGTNNLSAPFRGTLDLLTRRATHLVLIQLLALTLFTIIVAYRFKNSRVLVPVKASWLLYGVMASCLSYAVWSADTNYLRALSEYSTYGLLIVMAESTWRMRTVLALSMFAFICYRANSVLHFF